MYNIYMDIIYNVYGQDKRNSFRTINFLLQYIVDQVIIKNF